MTGILQCLGGWCRQRQQCQHYFANPLPNREPIERLCGEIEEPELFKPRPVDNSPVDNSCSAS